MYAPLDDLIQTLGLDLARKFVEAFGGERIYIPQAQHVTAENDLAKVIGIGPTRALAALWAQEYVEVPNARRHVLAFARDAMLADRDNMSIRQLVKKYKLTRRSVCRILAEGPQPESKQRRLF